MFPRLHFNLFVSHISSAYSVGNRKILRLKSCTRKKIYHTTQLSKFLVVLEKTILDPLFPQPRLPAFGVSPGAHAGEAEAEAGGRRCQRKMRHRLLRCARGVAPPPPCASRRGRSEGGKEGAPERGGEEERREKSVPKERGRGKEKKCEKWSGKGIPPGSNVSISTVILDVSVGDP